MHLIFARAQVVHARGPLTPLLTTVSDGPAASMLSRSPVGQASHSTELSGLVLHQLLWRAGNGHGDDTGGDRLWSEKHYVVLNSVRRRANTR